MDSLRDKGGQTLSELEPQFDMTRFGVMKHLGFLKQAGLITSMKQRRFKSRHLNAVPLQTVIDRWIAPRLAMPVARGRPDPKSHRERTDDMLDTIQKPDLVHQTISCGDTLAAHHFACHAARADAKKPGD